MLPNGAQSKVAGCLARLLAFDAHHSNLTVNSIFRRPPEASERLSYPFLGGASPESLKKAVTLSPYAMSTNYYYNLHFSSVLNNYMMWRVVASLAPSLSEEFRDAHEDLVKVLTGSKRSEDLWKRCMGETDDAIGMALGSLFIEKAFEGSSKQEVLR